MYLPEDLMLQILVRLPAKSLSRLRSVCKTWLAIIDSPSFMSQYLMITYGAPSNDRNVHLICQNGVFGSTSMTFLLCDELMIDVKGAPCISDVYEDTNRWFYHGFLGPINGIYCIVTSLSYTRRCTMMFWNPGNGQLHVLPPIPHPVLPHDLEDMYNELGLDPLDSFYGGFGFDPLAEDYKFMSISEYGDKFAGENHVTRFHVYSLGSNSWQQLVPSEIAYPDVISVYDDAHGHARFVPVMGQTLSYPFNNSCHWFYDTLDETYMLSFDFAKHVFHVINPPRTVLGSCPSMFTTVDGCLGVVNWLNGQDQIFDVCVMKEYGVEESWIKAYTVILDSPATFLGIVEDEFFCARNRWMGGFPPSGR